LAGGKHRFGLFRIVSALILKPLRLVIGVPCKALCSSNTLLKRPGPVCCYQVFADAGDRLRIAAG